MPTDSSKAAPPYMSYGVFKSAIETLAEVAVPSGALDRRVLDKLSGADHSALMSGLTFLGYVDADRRATPEYRKLINAWKTDTQGTDKHEYEVLLYEALTVKYADIAGGIDIETGTAAELEKAFKAYGVPAGQMLTKTIRFYIKALQECGAQISTFITKAKPRTARNGAKRPDKVTPKGSIVQSGKEHLIPRGFERMPVPGLPDAFVQFPLNLTEAHCDLFDSVVRVLRTFAKGRSGGKENVT
jgi:hypothetical protein